MAKKRKLVVEIDDMPDDDAFASLANAVWYAVHAAAPGEFQVIPYGIHRDVLNDNWRNAGPEWP